MCNGGVKFVNEVILYLRDATEFKLKNRYIRKPYSEGISESGVRGCGDERNAY